MVAAKTVDKCLCQLLVMMQTKDIIPTSTRLPDGKGKGYRYCVDKAAVDSVVEDIFMLPTPSVVEGIDSGKSYC